jgi:hypothetical protein
MLELKWTEAMHRLHATHARAKIHGSLIGNWQVFDTSKPITPDYDMVHMTCCPLAMGQSTWSAFGFAPYTLHYYYKIDNCHCMTSNLRNTCLLLIEGAIIHVKHWLGLIRQSNLATLCSLPTKFSHHLSIHPPRALLINLSTHNYVPQFVPLPLAQVKNGDKQFWK